MALTNALCPSPEKEGGGAVLDGNRISIKLKVYCINIISKSTMQNLYMNLILISV